MIGQTGFYFVDYIYATCLEQLDVGQEAQQTWTNDRRRKGI